MSYIVNKFKSNYKYKKLNYKWIKTQDLEYCNILEKLFTRWFANRRYVESITIWQNMLALFSNEEKISSRLGSAKFLEILISNSKLNANFIFFKDLNQKKSSRSTSSIWNKLLNLDK